MFFGDRAVWVQINQLIKLKRYNWPKKLKGAQYESVKRGTMKIIFAILIVTTFAVRSIAAEQPPAVTPAAENPRITEIDIKKYINQPTNSNWESLRVDKAIYEKPFKVSLFKPQNGEDRARLGSMTWSVAAYGFGVAGVLSVLPEDYTGWTKDDVKLKDKWWENVSEVAVWDRDIWYINLIGHPYSGGLYYQTARKSGYRQWDSFMYSFLMSTFYWEYGLEAFAEIPSIQDLVVTPVLGWAYGEWAFNKEQEIRKRSGLVWGSRFWGNISLFLLDPVDAIGVGINNLFNRQLIAAGTGYVSYGDVDVGNGELDKQLRFNARYTIGRPESKYYSRYNDATGDPIDTGIIGLTLGVGHIALDEKWGYKDVAYPEVSLGLYFSKQYSLRLKYGRANELEHVSTTDTVFYENYSLDNQFYFNAQSSTRPYVSVGVGEHIFAKDRDEKYLLWNVGAGLHHKISSNWAAQLDWQHYYGDQLYTHEQTISARAVYRFGRGEN